MIEIQERDKTLFIYMAKYGIVNRGKINEIYGFDKDKYSSYITERKRRLNEEGYIIKNNKYALLGEKGRKYLRNIGINEFRVVPTNKYSRDRMVKIASLLIELEDVYEIKQSPKIKDEIIKTEVNKDDKNEENKLSEMIGEIRKYKVCGELTNKATGKIYYLYNIGKIDKPTSKTILLKQYYVADVRNEIRKLRQKIDIKNVIIMAEDEMTMNIYKQNIETMIEGEQLLIPYVPEGIRLLKELGRRNIKEDIIKELYGNQCKVSDWKLADYCIDDKQITILVNNDVARIRALNDYYESGISNLTRNMQLEIICLNGQQENLRKQLHFDTKIIEANI